MFSCICQHLGHHPPPTTSSSLSYQLFAPKPLRTSGETKNVTKILVPGQQVPHSIPKTQGFLPHRYDKLIEILALIPGLPTFAVWTVPFYKIKCDKTIPFHSGPFRRIMTSCIYTVMPIVGYGFYCIPYFTAYPLLGMYLLITYTYKRMCLLTRVYTGRVNIVMRSYSASAVCWFHATDFWFL